MGEQLRKYLRIFSPQFRNSLWKNEEVEQVIGQIASTT